MAQKDIGAIFSSLSWAPTWFGRIIPCALFLLGCTTSDLTTASSALNSDRWERDPCGFPYAEAHGEIEWAYLNELATYMNDKLLRAPTDDEMLISHALTSGPNIEAEPPRASRYHNVYTICDAYVKWKRSTDPLLGNDTRPIEEPNPTLTLLEQMSQNEGVYPFFILATELARAYPEFRIYSPLESYPSEAIGDSAFARTTKNYEMAVRRAANAWKQLILDQPLPVTGRQIRTAWITARINGLPYDPDEYFPPSFRTNTISYRLERVFPAIQNVIGSYNTLYPDATLPLPFVANTRTDYSLPGIPTSTTAYREVRSVLDYWYIQPPAFDEALTSIANSTDAMLRGDTDNPTTLAYIAANLSPFNDSGNWGYFYPLLTLIRQHLGHPPIQSNGLDLLMMSSENMRVASGLYGAWSKGRGSHNEPTTLIDFIYKVFDNPDKNPLLRYIDLRKCR